MYGWFKMNVVILFFAFAGHIQCYAVNYNYEVYYEKTTVPTTVVNRHEPTTETTSNIVTTNIFNKKFSPSLIMYVIVAASAMGIFLVVLVVVLVVRCCVKLRRHKRNEKAKDSKAKKILPQRLTDAEKIAEIKKKYRTEPNDAMYWVKHERELAKKKRQQNTGSMTEKARRFSLSIQHKVDDTNDNDGNSNNNVENNSQAINDNNIYRNQNNNNLSPTKDLAHQFFNDNSNEKSDSDSSGNEDESAAVPEDLLGKARRLSVSVQEKSSGVNKLSKSVKTTIIEEPQDPSLNQSPKNNNHSTFGASVHDSFTPVKGLKKKPKIFKLFCSNGKSKKPKQNEPTVTVDSDHVSRDFNAELIPGDDTNEASEPLLKRKKKSELAEKRRFLHKFRGPH